MEEEVKNQMQTRSEEYGKHYPKEGLPMKKVFLLAVAALALFSCGQRAGQQTGKEADSAVNPSEYQSSNPDNMQQVRDFLHKAGAYFLATVDGDQPEVRPFGTAEIIEGKLYIQTGHVKNVAKQIAANPKVAICAYDGTQWLMRMTTTRPSIS